MRQKWGGREELFTVEMGFPKARQRREGGAGRRRENAVGG